MKKIVTLALSLILVGCETENTWWDKDALRKSLAGTYSTSWTTQGEDTRQLSLILEDQMVELPQVGDALPFSLSIDGGSPLEGYLPLIALAPAGGPRHMRGQVVKRERRPIPINEEDYLLHAFTFRIDEDGQHILEGLIFDKIDASSAAPMAYAVYFSLHEPDPLWQWPDTFNRIP